MPRNVQKTRKQWAAEIRAAHRQSVEAILKIGRLLIAAKRALPHGGFQEMIEHDLSFGPRTAQMLMAIAADRRLTNAKCISRLPPHWGTLAELHQLSDPAFEKAMAAGKISPEMTRDEASHLRFTIYTREEAERILSPVRTTANPVPMHLNITRDDTPPRQLTVQVRSDLAPPSGLLWLDQVERIVGDAVQRGDVRADDADFVGRVRAVAFQLLSLIGDGNPKAIN
jgi:hypothetical protein